MRNLYQTVLRIERSFTGFRISTEKDTNTIIRSFFCFAMRFASFHLFSAIFLPKLFFQLLEDGTKELTSAKLAQPH